jgi:CRISPR/Cas system-associated protein Csm6
MTPVVAPPPAYETASSAVVVPAPAFVGPLFVDDLIEERMDYSPIAAGSVAGPDHPDEVWVSDTSGPTGF